MPIPDLPLFKHRDTVVTPADQNQFVTQFENTMDTMSNDVIPAINLAITDINGKVITATTAGNESVSAKNIAVAAKNEALTAVATLQAGAIDNTVIAPNKTFSNQYINNNFVKSTENQTVAGVKTFSSNIVGNVTGNITGNASTATKLSTNRSNYKGITDSVVVGELMWKNYGNGHTIFDASAFLSPTGVTKDNKDPDIPWSTSLPTLMGYNGSNTYGVRVDSSRTADRLITTIGTAPAYACRAWVNFNGTGTVAIIASGNVSSITDNGVGDYTVNFTTAMPDDNYTCSGMCVAGNDTIDNSDGSLAPYRPNTYTPSINAFRVKTGGGGTFTPSDSRRVLLSFHR